MPFSKLKLSTPLQELLKKNNYTKPTAIQEQVIFLDIFLDTSSYPLF